MRMGWLIDRFLGRKHDEISKIVGRGSVQVKAQDSKALARHARIGVPGLSDRNITESSHL